MLKAILLMMLLAALLGWWTPPDCATPGRYGDGAPSQGLQVMNPFLGPIRMACNVKTNCMISPFLELQRCPRNAMT